LGLDQLKQRYPSVPIIALTATADERTQKEIVHRLGLSEGRHFICGFDRPNIQYRIEQKNKAKNQLLHFLKSEQAGNSGVVYCLSRKKVEDVAEWLCKQGYRALPFHAGMAAELRQKHQDCFLREENIIIVATIAFGMGIDKPDVRFVVHMDMPKSVEAYYQETGRAGRDGAEATALLLYGIDDVVKLKQMADASDASEEFKRLEQQRLNALLGLCELVSCRRQVLLRYFGDDMPEPCGNCDNCLSPPQTWDATTDALMALSCVYRTGQRFGVNQVIDVLRGANTEKIRQFGHHNLSTYGIGKSMSVNEWRLVFRQLIARGFLQVDSEQYGSLRLTEESRPVLRGETKLDLRRDINLLESKAKTKKSPRILDEIEEDDRALWKALRAERKRLADEHGVPPYVIFHDATLSEMLIHRPRTPEDLLRINGVGDQKMARFGEQFLEIIAEDAFS
jgi:ATP-dependent DNA helicase RecQ